MFVLLFCRQTKVHNDIDITSESNNENTGHFYDKIGKPSILSTAIQKTENNTFDNSTVIYEADSSQSPAYLSLMKLSTTNNIKSSKKNMSSIQGRENLYSDVLKK